MQIGRSRGQDGTSRLYYRCLNEKHCGRGKKSIRGKLVLSEINRVIEEKLVKLPPKAYDKYLDEIKEYSGATKAKLRSELASTRATKKGYEDKITNLSTYLGMPSDVTAKTTISVQIGEASLPKIDKAEFQDAMSKMAIKLKRLM